MSVAATATETPSLHRLTESDVHYCDHRDQGEYSGLLSDFNRNTDKHIMRVLHDDGLYRHLNFRPSEGPSFYWFDIITWPGALTITGDMGTYTFRRVEDMFQFFTGYINTSYWAEKLQNGVSGGRDAVRHHDADQFRTWLLQDFWEWSRDQDPDGGVVEAWRLLRDELLDTYALYNAEDRNECIARLQNMPGKLGARYQDCWEVSWDKYDFHFECCLAAILTGIRTYKAWKESRDT